MIPEIKTHTANLKKEAQELSEGNARLLAENNGLKGSLGDSVKHYSSKNAELQKTIEQQKEAAKSFKGQNEEMKGKLDSMNKSLNIKTQEVILQQEAFAEKQKAFDELSYKVNELNNSNLQLQDQLT